MCRRVKKLPEFAVDSSPRTHFRNAIVAVSVALLERSIVAAAKDAEGRKSHQVSTTPIFGKLNVRRCRRSTCDVLVNLRIARKAGHAAAVLRASGSHWIHAATARTRCNVYRERAKHAFKNAHSVSLCWAGVSASGLNVQVALGYDVGAGVGAFLTPKAFVCSRVEFL